MHRILRRLRARRASAPNAWSPRPQTRERARRALACLVVATEILMVALTGAGTVTVECRLVTPIGEHRIGVTAWIARGARVEPGRRLVLPACLGVASVRE
jgi:hypothetical protein